MSLQNIPLMAGDDNDKSNCPVCGMSVRLVRRTTGEADHYEAIRSGEGLAQILPPQTPEVSAKLKKLRKGKKTVAFVGLAPTSCSLAPFDDPDVEIWALNETHAFTQWFKRWDRWFQIHESKSWKRYIAKRDVRGHYKWLKKYHWGEFESIDVPMDHEWQDKSDFWEERQDGNYLLMNGQEHKLKTIYMQYWDPYIPCSVEYPLAEVSEIVFRNFRRGDDEIKYFTSTFAYMMGIAVLEKFERVEIYGFEMSDDIEYVKQKACAEFWIGYAMASGIEMYTPPGNQIMWSALYGGNEQGAGW